MPSQETLQVANEDQLALDGKLTQRHSNVDAAPSGDFVRWNICYT